LFSEVLIDQTGTAQLCDWLFDFFGWLTLFFCNLIFSSRLLVLLTPPMSCERSLMVVEAVL